MTNVVPSQNPRRASACYHRLDGTMEHMDPYSYFEQALAGMTVVTSKEATSSCGAMCHCSTCRNANKSLQSIATESTGTASEHSLEDDGLAFVTVKKLTVVDGSQANTEFSCEEHNEGSELSSSSGSEEPQSRFNVVEPKAPVDPVNRKAKERFGDTNTYSTIDGVLELEERLQRSQEEERKFDLLQLQLRIQRDTLKLYIQQIEGEERLLRIAAQKAKLEHSHRRQVEADNRNY